MNDSSEIQKQLLAVAEGLIEYRFHLARLLFGLESKEAEEALARADLESAIVDHFDPLLKAILKVAGGLRGTLLEAALDLAGLRHRLHCVREALPVSEDEEAMLEGRIPADLPVEIRLSLVAVIDDQLDLAYHNLLRAVRCTTEVERPSNEAAEAA
ncbi:MAG: hypothetical protein ABUT39_27700 [Acidobacteriota bacterium]